MQKKIWKWLFRPAFGVCSSQMLIQIYNTPSCVILLHFLDLSTESFWMFRYDICFIKEYLNTTLLSFSFALIQTNRLHFWILFFRGWWKGVYVGSELPGTFVRSNTYVTERWDRTDVCLKSVLRLIVDKGQV